MSKKSPPLLLIEWEDAYSAQHTWTKIDDLPKKIKGLNMQTVGFEVRRSKKRITLAMAYDKDNHKATDFFCIPTGMIKSEKLLG